MAKYKIKTDIEGKLSDIGVVIFNDFENQLFNTKEAAWDELKRQTDAITTAANSNNVKTDISICPSGDELDTIRPNVTIYFSKPRSNDYYIIFYWIITID